MSMSTITTGFLDHKIFEIVSEVAAEKGVRAFVIGGYVRDCFLGRPSKDIDIVVEGNKAKFGQNPELKEYLLSTDDAILVEASPYDKIWGIGLDRDTAINGKVEDWKGENLLGCALMEVRDYLRNMK